MPSFYPPDFELPMVAPSDLGTIAAELLTEPAGEAGWLDVRHAEGPRTYSPAAVAGAFGEALGKPVTAGEIPPARWRDVLKSWDSRRRAPNRSPT